ncbi:MAG TPA: hypothetical protein VFQ65_18160, partial [Kofleriaceae bacterium]|nr:hypothetical protein [Kofleriaceae bacterium]
PGLSTTTIFYMTRSAVTTAQWNMPAPVIYTDGGFTVRKIAFGPGMHVVVGTVSSTNIPSIYDATFDLTTKTLGSFAMLIPGGSDPYLTADGMHLYFDTPTANGNALFVASRRTPTEAFAPQVLLSELSSGDSVDTAPWVSSGGHTIYFGSKRGTATMPALYTAQRMSF